MLRKAIGMYGRLEQILSDHGSTFYAIESDEREKRLTEFEKFLRLSGSAFKFFEHSIHNSYADDCFIQIHSDVYAFNVN